MAGYRYRIRFRKVGDLRLIGHQDLARLWERVFRRAGLRLAMSEGFHPKARLSFPLALPLGVAGHDEVLEVHLVDQHPPASLQVQLYDHLPAGLEIVAVEELPPGAPKAQVLRVRYQAQVPPARQAHVAQRVAEVLAADTCVVTRAEDGRQVDVRPDIEELTCHDGQLFFTLRHHHHAGARPRDVLTIVGLGDIPPLTLDLTRTCVDLQEPVAGRSLVSEQRKDVSVP